jgi:hypothetical protein
MIKDNMLKPLPYRIHIICWTIYLVWVTAVNVYKFGWGHLPVMFFLALIMLPVSYANRAWLRRMLFRKFSVRHLFTLLVYFLLTMLVVFLVLYQFPTVLSKKVLKNPDLFKAIDFGIDVLTFYISFALKGVMILSIEIGYNLTIGLFRDVGLMREQSMASIKMQSFRNWTVHFMGNLTQSFARLGREKPVTLTRIDLFLSLQAYAMRKLQFADCMLGTMEDEIRYLRMMMRLYGETHVILKTDVDDLNRPIIPMTLLSLYKNMVKHADLEDMEQPAIIEVFVGEQRITIKSVNRIAQRSAWIFEAGGTGLEQLTKLLQMEYGDAFSLIKKKDDGIFYLDLEINFKHENKRKINEAR